MRTQARLPAAGWMSELGGRSYAGYDIVVGRYDVAQDGSNYIFLGVQRFTTNPSFPGRVIGRFTGSQLPFTDGSVLDTFLLYRRQVQSTGQIVQYQAMSYGRINGSNSGLSTVGHTLESSSGNFVVASNNREANWNWLLARVGQTIHISR